MQKKKMLLALALTLAMSFANVAAADTFERGDEGQEVLEIQKRLVSLHYNIDKLDGDFGPATEKAVRQFQIDRGLEDDGVVGPSTYKALLNKDIPVNRGSGATIRRIIKQGYSVIGTPYVFGATGPYAFDCSGFVRYAFASAGVSLPRAADAQYEYGRKIPMKNLREGDLIFFSTYEAGASHVGIYLGGGRFLHAGSSTGVTVSNAFDSYWGSRYYGACRIL